LVSFIPWFDYGKLVAEIELEIPPDTPWHIKDLNCQRHITVIS